MRTRQSIVLIMLALFFVSCQTATPPKSPIGRQSQGAKSLGTLSEYTQLEKESGQPVEVVQSLNEKKGEEKEEKKKKSISIMGRSLPSGLLSPEGQEALSSITPGAEPERQKIVLNFDKADISEVTSQIFGDQLKVNYVLDQGLQGRISMYIEGEFNPQELLQIVTRAYEANGVSVVPKKGMYFIQSSQKTTGTGLPIADSMLLKAQKDGVRPIIVIYRLKYMDAKQASNLASPFLSAGRKVIVESLTNSLIFIEETENARSIINLLKTIDINILQEVSMEIIPLQSIAPQDAVQGMETLLNKLGGVKESAIKNNIAFIPLQSFGGVLVMAQNSDLLKSAKQWINALDVQGVESGEQIYVYFIQNGLARDIGDILNSVYGLGGGGGTRRLEQQVVASGGRSSSTRSGGFGTGSGSSFGGSSFGGSSSLGSRTGSSSSTGTGTTGSTSGSTFGGAGSTYGSSASRGMSGTSAVGSTGTAGAQGAGKPKIFTGEVTVIADEVNNAIVVRANASDYAKIKKTIETLDLLPRAVLIEVMIAEITLNKDLQYGIKYWFQHNPSDPTGLGLSLGGLSNKQTGTSTSGSTSTTTLGFPNIGDVAGAGLGMSWIATAKDLAIFLNFLSSKTNINILSNPSLLATDNKDATITVGGRQPVPTGSFTGGTTTDLAATSVFSTIQYEETGTILNVTPHINAGGLVRLEVEGIIRRVGPNATVGANNQAPTFVERNIKTTLLAQSGSTVIIGGILDSSENNERTGIPALQSIPIIKTLFSSTGSTLEKTELIVAITPHVIDQRGSEASREFLEKMRNLKMRIQR